MHIRYNTLTQSYILTCRHAVNAFMTVYRERNREWRETSAKREIRGDGKCKETEGKKKTGTGTGSEEMVWELKYGTSLIPTFSPPS